jgi:autoinducer 2-degrading protein
VIECVRWIESRIKEEINMLVVNVFVQVKPEFIDEFRVATIENAKNSVKEPGIARFNVLQDLSDERKFLLIEVYRTQEDTIKHKETRHYKRWSQNVMKMMAEPRRSVKYASVYPNDSRW